MKMVGCPLRDREETPMLKDIVSGFVSFFRKDLPTDDRRQDVRARCRYAVYCVDVKDISEATVIDMGVQGLRLEGHKKYRPGEYVKLIFRGVPSQQLSQVPADKLKQVDNAIRCEVSWSEDAKGTSIHTGLLYHDTPDQKEKSWVTQVLSQLGFDSGAWQQRERIRARARLEGEAHAGEERVKGQVLNIGVGGIMFGSREQLAVDKKYTFFIGPLGELKRLRLQGEVVNRRFDVPSNMCQHGVKFEVPDEHLDLMGKYVIQLLKDQAS